MSAVLVVRRGGLGDTLLMLPTLRALRRLHPGRPLHFAGVAEFASVLLAHGAVDRVLSSEDLALWSLREPGTPAWQRLRGYALIVSDDPAVMAVASEDTKVLTFDPHPRTGAPIALQIARQLGLEPDWPLDAALLPPRVQLVDGPVCLAPGSGSRSKCWPRDRWLELAERLAASGHRVQVVVGPVEQERDEPRSWPWPTEVSFVAEREVTALASRLAGAAAFVGNDSGPSHLATMLGVPTVVIFGPTVASVWAPPGPHVTVVGGDGRELPAIACVEVLHALHRHGSRARTLRQ